MPHPDTALEAASARNSGASGECAADTPRIRREDAARPLAHGWANASAQRSRERSKTAFFDRDAGSGHEPRIRLKDGVEDGIRTRDPRNHNPML